ncbi:MAG: YIP1 family protein [Ignavibacteriales bacterium]|nr:YIP1 family protein [Ignavibacteriales bacterium]
MQEQQPSGSAPSMMSKIVNIFSSPADSFEGISSSPSKASAWLFPFLAAFVISVLISYLLVANEMLRAQIVDQQAQAMQKMVDSGRMTQQQADASVDRMQSMGGGMFMAFGIIGALVFLCVYYFGGSLFLWLTGKLALKSTAGYGKYLEVYGMSAWVGVLGAIVTVLLMVGMSSLYASPSAALAILSDYDASNDTHKFLSALNVFSVWQATVVGIGLSKLTGKPAGVSFGVSFGLWAVWVVISVLLGIAR